MEFFIGIDQSINSSGITFQVYKDNELIDKHFFIITGDKLSKKAEKAQSVYKEFDYLIYDKQEPKNAIDSHEAELFKTHNLISISHFVIGIISSYIKRYNGYVDAYICMEGISYQSANTRSVMELAGLNYIIRYDIIRYFTTTEEGKLFHNWKLIVAPPGQIKKFTSGFGTAKKDTMISLFEASHPNLYLIPKIDDIADSFWMSEYAHNIYNEKHLPEAQK